MIPRDLTNKKRRLLMSISNPSFISQPYLRLRTKRRVREGTNNRRDREESET